MFRLSRLSSESILPQNGLEKKSCKQKCWNLWCCGRNRSNRFWVGIMIFLVIGMSYLTRMDFNAKALAIAVNKFEEDAEIRPYCNRGSIRLNKIRMFGSLNPYKNKTSGSKEKWDSDKLHFLQRAYWLGYALISIPAGIIVEYSGAKRVILWTLVGKSFLIMLSVPAAYSSYSMLVVDRFMTGVLGGMLEPSFHYLIARWALPQEKFNFVAVMMFGQDISAFIALLKDHLMTLYLESWWKWHLFIQSLFLMLLTIPWAHIVEDHPMQHKGISKVEQRRIMGTKTGLVHQGKVMPPFWAIIGSLPVWAAAMGHFGSHLGYHMAMINGDIYLARMQGINLENARTLSRVPYLSRAVSALICGFTANWLYSRRLLGATTVIKFFTVFSHVIPGILLFFVASVGCNVTAAFFLMFGSMALNGASAVSVLFLSQGMSPNFAPTITGFMNLFSGMSGNLNDVLTYYITRQDNIHRQDPDKWATVYNTGGAIYIVCGAFILSLGTADVQKWDTIINKQ